MTMKNKLIKFVSQKLADFLIFRLEQAVKNGDKEEFEMSFVQACKLNAYCVVFHNIYID